MANLNGKQIVEQGIITNVINKECIQQVGVDLELIKIERVMGTGIIPQEGKTKLGTKIPVPMVDCPNPKGDEKTKGWLLTPGAYDITLEQGCKIPANQRLQIVQRSSVLRNGGVLASSMFDPGFETDHIGTVMFVFASVFIHFGARVAQAYTTEVNEVENLYDGQWQGDKQREEVGSDRQEAIKGDPVFMGELEEQRFKSSEESGGAITSFADLANSVQGTSEETGSADFVGEGGK